MKCSGASQTCPVVGGSPTEMRSGQGLLGVWAWAGWSWGRTGGVGSGAIASGGSLVVGASALRSGAGASGERHLVHRGPGGRWQPSCGFGQNSTSFPFDFLLALPLTCEGCHHLFIGGLFSLSQALFWARFSHSGHCSLRPTSSPLPDSENLICCRTEVTSSYVLSVVRSGIESSEAKMPVHLRRWRSCGSPVTLAGAETSLTVLSVVSREDADGLTALLFLPSRALCLSPLARTVKPGNRSRHTGFRM